MLSAAVLLAGAVGASALCDECGIRNAHTKSFSTPFDGSVEEYPACKSYQDAACCDLGIVKEIAAGYAIYDSASEVYNMAACDADLPDDQKMSQECKDFFTNEFCFYECDVNLSKYRLHKDCKDGDDVNGWQLFKAPVKASYCDAWYEACKDDYFCINDATNDISYFAHPPLNADGNCTVASGNCKKFSDIYGKDSTKAPGEMVCEDMWLDSFLYDRSNEGFVMAFPEGEANPNDAAHVDVAVPDSCPDHNKSDAERDAACDAEGFQQAELKPCEVCHLRNDHTLDVAKTNPDLASTVCQKYDDNACCSADIAARIGSSDGLYGDAFRWDKCYRFNPDLKAALEADADQKAAFDRCNRWFQVEECFYECDVNAGKFRKNLDCADDSGSNGWQMIGAPFKASECDAFYNDCKDLLLCGCTGDDCKDGMYPFSLFGASTNNGDFCRGTEFCSKPVKEIWASPKDWCEKLFDNAFTYEEHEARAYSWAWNDERLQLTDDHVYSSNPNNAVLPLKGFPANCPSHDATPEMCTESGEIAPSPAPAQGEGSSAAAVAASVACAAVTLASIAVL